MKRSALIIVAAFVMILALGSCNKKECPAYSKAGTVQTGRTV